MPYEDNPVLQALRQRRSIRAYTDEPLPREAVLSILDAGRWAPSGMNNQPCRFLVITADDPRQAALADCTKYSSIVLAARVLIAVFLDRGKMYNEVKDYQGAGACIQNMLLATHALGYGAVWLGEILNQGPEVFKVLKLDPERFCFMALLALGRPTGPARSTRMELDQFLLEDF